MRVLTIICSLLLLISCLENQFDGTPVQDKVNLTFQITTDESTFSKDPFKILSMTPVDHKLLVEVEYPGGCEIHRFDVVWNGELERTDYAKARLTIYHFNNGDACEGSIKQVLELDLKTSFNDQYDKASLLLTVKNGYNQRSIKIHPKLAGILQGTDCLIRTKLENSLCGQGIWQNNWLQMEDSLGFKRPVWLQPVKYLPNISASIPDDGSYTVGVTLLFGYQTNIDKSCLTIPEGEVVPVEINCISSL